jgi:hypothetical protein
MAAQPPEKTEHAPITPTISPVTAKATERTPEQQRRYEQIIEAGRKGREARAKNLAAQRAMAKTDTTQPVHSVGSSHQSNTFTIVPVPAPSLPTATLPEKKRVVKRNIMETIGDIVSPPAPAKKVRKTSHSVAHGSHSAPQRTIAAATAASTESPGFLATARSTAMGIFATGLVIGAIQVTGHVFSSARANYTALGGAADSASYVGWNSPNTSRASGAGVLYGQSLFR